MLDRRHPLRHNMKVALVEASLVKATPPLAMKGKKKTMIHLVAWTRWFCSTVA